TYLLAYLRAKGDKEEQEAAEGIQEAVGDLPGVTLGGEALANQQVNEQVSHDIERAELFALPLIFLLSLLFFRGVVAAALPPLLGGLAIVLTFAGLRAASELGSVSIFAVNLVTALGLGLAIDYSLFMVSRYREELARVGPGGEAIRNTLATAGRTVLFSGLTVAAALSSLLVFPQRFLYSMGLGGVMVALIAVGVALIVLPALLAVLGERVNALAPKRLQRAARKDARPASNGFWYRLSRVVMRRPGRIALASAVALVVLGLPFLDIRFVVADAEVLPGEASARQVDDALAERFDSNATEPVRLVVEAPLGAELEPLVRQVRGLQGVAGVSRPERLRSDTTLLNVTSRDDPLSTRGQDVVREIRALDTPLPLLVSGTSASFADLKASLLDHLPVALAIVVMATLVLLFLMTGSVVLPIKALVMNVLTLSATFGILVLVFQDGRLEGLLGYESQGALEITQPIVLFAVAFGLATDYGVFLLSRIKEARDAGVPDSEAVAVGLERTGRIVTAAALLFTVAVGALATSDIIFIKQLGVGTALAVLIDATVVRALLVPSLMELLGRRNWWAPRPLRRLHERVGLREAPT
ncbi:MAG TPA: MMPL family transporter, partial [Thermoleophilaceae bacterium]|nr:MMPL family transporter [Thermoleophilaceae bacterium]